MNLADAYRWTPALASKAPATYRRAVQIFQSEIAINPRDAQLRSKLATCWAALRETQLAEGEIERALQLAPNDGAVHFRAALVYEQGAQRDRALREVAAALQANYALPEILNAPPLR
jgi:serine/threonine-protein kinase